MAWSSLTINNQEYLIKTEVTDDSVVLYLCDFKEILQEKCSGEDILTRAKKLNKRIEFNTSTIMETIKTTPSNAEVVKIDDVLTTLQVKYYLSNRPFKFHWMLNSAPRQEFLQLVIHPLLFSMKNLAEQNVELKEIIKKKDVEIEQYKIEGAVLKRNKVATEQFSPQKFDAQHPKIPEDYLKYAKNQFDQIKKSCLYLLEQILDTEEEGNKNNLTTSPSTSSGLGHKNVKKPSAARNMKAQRDRELIKRITAKSSTLNYDDSDSGTPDSVEEFTNILQSYEDLKCKQKEDLDMNSPSKPKRTKFFRKELNI